ncbi:aminoglycoside phosphotransferase family protein [Nocardia aurea]|uniref:Aminoglycoside phosphotransferase family protein n=1 Tax=Nocardia aurea TaxID=2144174 RepID=A0ABV3G4W8_9NOCA
MNSDTSASGLLRVLNEAAAINGVDPIGAELVRAGSNTIYRVCDVVARIGNPGCQDTAQRELRVSQWLNESGLRTVDVADVVHPFAVVDGRPVTWWRTIPDHRPSTPAELGGALRRLHTFVPPTTFTLPHHDPFSGLHRQINVAGYISNDDRGWLATHLHSLREQYDDLEPMDTPRVIHGDAWQGNLVVPADETPILLDLERVSLGRVEWDLVQIAADYTDFARLSAIDYAAFVDSYGDDLTTHEKFRLFADIQELRWTVFALSQAEANTKAAAQVQLRLACIRGDVARPWSWEAL